MRSNGRPGFARGLFFGATLGALTAVLLAPKAGRAMRSELFARGERLKRRASEGRSRLDGLGEEAMSRLRDAARETAGGVKRGAGRFVRRSDDGRYDRGPSPVSF
jgi:gas vesicle protein